MIVEQDIAKALSVSQRVYCLQEGRVSLEGQSQTVPREEITRAYGLDRPLGLRYLDHMARLATGDLGQSYRSQAPVRTCISERAGARSSCTRAPEASAMARACGLPAATQTVRPARSPQVRMVVSVRMEAARPER